MILQLVFCCPVKEFFFFFFFFFLIWLPWSRYTFCCPVKDFFFFFFFFFNLTTVVSIQQWFLLLSVLVVTTHQLRQAENNLLYFHVLHESEQYSNSRVYQLFSTTPSLFLNFFLFYWLHPLFWGPCLLVWTFWFVIRLWIYDFELRLWYHDRNYLLIFWRDRFWIWICHFKW